MLATRHDRHREAEPLLPPVDARQAVEHVWRQEGVSGASAVRDGRVAGYLFGQLGDSPIWGHHVWVDRAGHAATVAAVERVVDAQGDLASFRTFQRQPAWRGSSTDEQLRRFFGTYSGRKIRSAAARGGAGSCASASTAGTRPRPRLIPPDSARIRKTLGLRPAGRRATARLRRRGRMNMKRSSTRRLAAWVLVLSLAMLAVTPPALAATAGSQLWAKRYDNRYDFAEALDVSPDGSLVFVTGSSSGGGGDDDYATLAYDAATGARRWLSRYGRNKDDEAAALAVSPDGFAVFVTGQSNGSGTSNDYATVGYDASTGSRLWAERYHKSNDFASAIAVSPDGSQVFVSGASNGAGTSFDYATIAYDAATGSQLWVKRYNGPTNGREVAAGVTVSPDGSTVFVTGSSGGTSSYDYATVAYDAATGSRLWLMRYDDPANKDDFASSLGVNPDGSVVFVTGGSPGAGSASDYATIAYDASTGSQLWLKRYNGPPSKDDYASALGVSPDGSQVFVTGRSHGSKSVSDYATIAYDASTGSRLWVKRYNPPSNRADYAHALGVSPDGSQVFVTGVSPGSAGYYDYATVAYDAANGSQLWLKRYNGGAGSYDFANAIGVGPLGSRVFVTGSSIDPGGTDYATVAYAAR